MTVQEANEYLKQLFEEVEQYRALGTVEELKEAREKQVAKKPMYVDERRESTTYYLGFLCPSCKESNVCQPYRPKHCKHCGQALKWEEGEQVISREKLIEAIKQDVIITTEEGLDLIGEIIDLIKEQPQADKWIPCKVKDIIDTIISHNEIVALWVKEETEDVRYDKRIWRGMAWEIPKQYMDCKFEKIFGTVPESIVEADTINIRIGLPQPYKKEGAE